MIIYLDQCILGYLSDKIVSLLEGDEYHYIYSDIHFQEFSHHKDPSLFLNVLKEINGKYLKLELDERFNYTGNANIYEGDPSVHFQDYKQNLSGLNFDPQFLNPLILWVNGANNREAVEQLPSDIQLQFSELLKKIGLDNETTSTQTKDLQRGYDELSKLFLKEESDIDNTYKALTPYGAASNSQEENPLAYIWENLIAKEIKNSMTSEQFYGFEPLPGQEDCKLYYQIIKCCQMLDNIGFYAEKKRRKADKLPNVLADSAHIANAICFCHVLVTADKKLAQRASAISQYKNRDLRIIYFDPVSHIYSPIRE